jgi:hypothetical protein
MAISIEYSTPAMDYRTQPRTKLTRKSGSTLDQCGKRG